MTEAAPLKPLDAIAVRITEYLSAGGLFNPEMAKHEAVRDLLMDCRDAIEADRRAPQAELAAMSADELRTRLQACLEVQRETAAHNRRLLGELDGEIAAPQAEPVAWAKFDSDGNCLAWQVGAHRQSAELDTPLYAGHAPEPQAEQAAERYIALWPVLYKSPDGSPAAMQRIAELDAQMAQQISEMDADIVPEPDAEVMAAATAAVEAIEHRASHAELVKAARLALKVATEMHELADNWPGIAYSYDLDERTKAAIAGLRAALPPEGKETP